MSSFISVSHKLIGVQLTVLAFGGLASALGAGLGINAGQSGAITSALKSGNYAAALTSLVDFSGSSAALGGLSTAIQSIDNGDIVGAFQGLSGPLGIDSSPCVECSSCAVGSACHLARPKRERDTLAG